MKIGDKIKFEGEKQRYTVQAFDSRYIICTKPFNVQKTVLYTIVDLERKVRGADNLVFSHGYESQLDCEQNLKSLQDGSMEVTYRNFKELEPSEIEALTNLIP
jgi:hypothetical protein